MRSSRNKNKIKKNMKKQYGGFIGYFAPMIKQMIGGGGIVKKKEKENAVVKKYIKVKKLF